MTENVNGIQVDVSKYVGQEIAKLAVATIEEDRMKILGQQAINEVFESRWFGSEKTSIVKRETSKVVSEKIQEYVAQIIETDEFKAQAKKRAEELVEEMQEAVKKIVIEQYANALAGNISTGYFGGMFTMNVQRIVQDMMQM